MTAVGEKLFGRGRLPSYVVSGSVLALVLVVGADELPHDVGVTWPLLLAEGKYGSVPPAKLRYRSL